MEKRCGGGKPYSRDPGVPHHAADKLQLEVLELIPLSGMRQVFSYSMAGDVEASRRLRPPTTATFEMGGGTHSFSARVTVTCPRNGWETLHRARPPLKNRMASDWLNAAGKTAATHRRPATGAVPAPVRRKSPNHRSRNSDPPDRWNLRCGSRPARSSR